MNTDNETQPNHTDLDSFQGAPPAKKLDDKAAILESELSGLKVQIANERSVFFFAISVLICVVIGLVAPTKTVFWFSVVSCCIINTVISRNFGAPLLANYLEPWNIRFQKAFDRHVLKISEDEYED